jgi:hypothetical protein
MNIKRPTHSLAALAAAFALIGAACGDDESTADTAPASAAETTIADGGTATTEAPVTTIASNPYEGDLVGLFELTAGDCTGGVTGSWFQMVMQNGTPEAGPYLPNADSLCTADTNYSLLTPGTAGGLDTAVLQIAPDPAYDAAGNGRAADIFAPVKFFGVDFAGAFDATGTAPSLTAADGVISGDLSAFTAYYGGQQFSQGATVTGTIDPATGAFVIEWSSLISGGSFNGLAGVWHLEGTFIPAD